MKKGVLAVALAVPLALSGCLGINDSPGKRVVRKRCSVCHSTARIYAHHRSEKEWREVVEAMIGHGARLTPQEKELLLRYLTTELGRPSPPGR